MGFSALFLSISRLSEVVDPRSLDLAGDVSVIASIADDSTQRDAVIKSLSKATENWIEKADLPTLDKLVETGKLECGGIFTHGGPFCAKDIVESNRQFYERKQLTSTPILQAELTSKDGSKLILEVQVHPENFISDSTASELTRNPGLFMVGRLTDVAPPNLKAQAYAIGFVYDQPTWQDDTIDQKSSDPVSLSEEQEADYSDFDYHCKDRIYIPGTRPISKRHLILVNDKEVRIGDGLFKLFLRFVVELKKNGEGWVYTQTLHDEGLIPDAQNYQRFDHLRTALKGYLLENDAKKFIENIGTKSYRISTHPDFISCDKKKLLEHEDAQIKSLAELLP